MGTLFSALASSGGALNVLTQALNVAQNNIGNASTAGYAAQQLNLQAMPMDVADGLTGGVEASGTTSSRDPYADTVVQQGNSQVGYHTAESNALSQIQGLFDTTGTGGIAGALNALFTSFSDWSSSPADPSVQQSVLSSASSLAASIQGLNSSLSQTSGDLGTQVGATVSQINGLASQIAQLNATALSEGGTLDPGSDAQLHSDLESLANLTSVNTLTQANGTTTVLMSNGSPLVQGGQAFALSATSAVDAGAANPQSPPTSHVFDSQGNDITSQVTGGQLGGLLDIRNNLLGGIIGDAQSSGSLNDLAKSIADTVNGILTSGTVSTAPGAAAGTALFTYSNSDPTAAAGSIALNAAITPGQLAPVDASGNSNGNANALAALADPSVGAGPLNGMSWTQGIAGIAANVGQAAQTAQQNLQSSQQALTQATGLRDQVSGVSLDGEATQVMELQRSYQAVARSLSIINGLADSILGLVPISST